MSAMSHSSEGSTRLQTPFVPVASRPLFPLWSNPRLEFGRSSMGAPRVHGELVRLDLSCRKPRLPRCLSTLEHTVHASRVNHSSYGPHAAERPVSEKAL
jgi:hypothetical protein